MSPKVGDWVTTMPSTWHNFESSGTIPIRTRFTLLFLSCFVTNGRSQVNLTSVFKDASVRADKYSETWLFEDVDVVVVGIPHGPPARMLPGFFTVRPVHETRVSISPILKLVISRHLKTWMRVWIIIIIIIIVIVVMNSWENAEELMLLSRKRESNYITFSCCSDLDCLPFSYTVSLLQQQFNDFLHNGRIIITDLLFKGKYCIPDDGLVC